MSYNPSIASGGQPEWVVPGEDSLFEPKCSSTCKKASAVFLALAVAGLFIALGATAILSWPVAIGCAVGSCVVLALFFGICSSRKCSQAQQAPLRVESEQNLHSAKTQLMMRLQALDRLVSDLVQRQSAEERDQYQKFRKELVVKLDSTIEGSELTKVLRKLPPILNRLESRLNTDRDSAVLESLKRLEKAIEQSAAPQQPQFMYMQPDTY